MKSIVVFSEYKSMVGDRKHKKLAFFWVVVVGGFKCRLALLFNGHFSRHRFNFFLTSWFLCF